MELHYVPRLVPHRNSCALAGCARSPSLGAGRGHTLVDRRSVSASPTAVAVAEGVDSDAAADFLVSRLIGLDRR